MIVISDTTPLHYLILIKRQFILPQLFSEIIIPDAVLLEMGHPNAPQALREWADAKPSWAIVRSGSQQNLQKIANAGLGKGETSAIAIAIDIGADAVLLDDRKAMREAGKNGLNILTTFALLELAAIEGLINFADSIEELSKTNFYFPPEHIVAEYLRRNE